LVLPVSVEGGRFVRNGRAKILKGGWAFPSLAVEAELFEGDKRRRGECKKAIKKNGQNKQPKKIADKNRPNKQAGGAEPAPRTYGNRLKKSSFEAYESSGAKPVSLARRPILAKRGQASRC
jgi:hypothetical protein